MNIKSKQSLQNWEPLCVNLFSEFWGRKFRQKFRQKLDFWLRKIEIMVLKNSVLEIKSVACHNSYIVNVGVVWKLNPKLKEVQKVQQEEVWPSLLISDECVSEERLVEWLADQ